MMNFGILLYAMIAALLVMFWRALRGGSLDDLFEQATHDHHHVHRVTSKDPIGGTWGEHSRWMEEEADR